MKDFASIIANISQKPIKQDISPYRTLLSFGYFWEEQPQCTQLFALHPLFTQNWQNAKALRYEIGTEYGIAWLLADALTFLISTSNPLGKKCKDLLQELDIGYLTSESNIAEETLHTLSQYIKPQTQPLGIVLGSELSTHTHSKAIATIFGILSANEHVDIIMPELADSIMPKNPATQDINDTALQICEYLPESNGHFVFIHPHKQDSIILRIPPLFAPALKLQNQQRITLSFESRNINAICECDARLKGTIAILYLPQTHDIGYPYKNVEVIL